MSEQAPTNTVSMRDCELICEKVCGWEGKRCGSMMYWSYFSTPSFTEWRHAEWIAMGLKRQGISVTLRIRPEGAECALDKDGLRLAVAGGDDGPLALRAATVNYVRELP